MIIFFDAVFINQRSPSVASNGVSPESAISWTRERPDTTAAKAARSPALHWLAEAQPDVNWTLMDSM